MAQEASAKKAKQSLAARVAKRAQKSTHDFDPENDVPSSDLDGHGSDMQESADDGAATEHYVAVETSKLRQRQSVALGPEYRGSRISRKALEQDVQGEDEEADTDKDGYSTDGESEHGKKLDDDDEHGKKPDDNDQHGKKPDKDDERAQRAQLAQLRQSFGQGQEQITAAILAGLAKEDVARGKAIRQQLRAYDAILNVRIRMQKALVAANSLNTIDASELVGDEASKGAEAFKGAEEACVKLLNTLGDLRQSLLPPGAKAKEAGGKRKYELAADMWNEEIEDQLRSTEQFARPNRSVILDRWASRTRQPSTMERGRQLKSELQTSLAAKLDETMKMDAERLIKRTQVPRSCAPVQAAHKVAEEADIYDDADFYQQLLKELVEQRNADQSAPGNEGPTVQWTAAAKEAKTRKEVDRKASKGRKLRYTVYEKLQNFMAPEDRRTWEDATSDRLFGSLFGQKVELKEEEEEQQEEEEGEDSTMGGMTVEDESLQLFKKGSVI